MKKNYWWLILLSIPALLLLFWYFVGLAFIDINVEEEMASGSSILKSGNFIEIDTVHKGNGQALLLKTGENAYQIRFENFQVTNGPDLYVYLSENTAVDDETELGNYKDLGRLKGNIGNQNYDITAEDAARYNSVVIWCKRFRVLFSSAELNAVQN